MTRLLDATVPVLAAVLLAGVAGRLAEAAGLPLPWMLGPLMSTAAAAMAGLRVRGSPLRTPAWVRAVCVPVIGVTIGASATPEIVAQAGRWWPTLLVVAPFVLTVQFLNYAVLRRLGGFDRPTAFFAASPGGLVDAVISGESRGGGLAAMSTQHFSRIALTVLLVPMLFAFFTDVDLSGGGGGLPDVARAPLALRDAAILLACAALGGLLGRALRLPAGVMLGPFALSAAAHLSGLTAAGVPEGVVHLAQVVVGAMLGLRFEGIARRRLAQGVALSFLTVALTLALAAPIAFGLARAVEAPPAALFLAFAPGGLAEMGLVAVAFGVEPAYVVIHHLMRIVLTVAMGPLLFDRLIARDRLD